MKTMLFIAAAATTALALAAAPASAMTFATFIQTGTKSNLTWSNPVTPAVYKTVPAVYKTVPAVTKIVKGKVVVVTPAKTVLVTAAQTVLVTPAHDGTSGTLFSTAAGSPAVPGLANVSFSFLNPGLSKLGPLEATLVYSGATPDVAPALSFAGLLFEPNVSGTLSLIYTGSKTLKVKSTSYAPGANLLTATKLGNLTLFGSTGGSTGSLTGSNGSGSDIVFTSDFLDFSKVDDFGSALQLTSITPGLGAAAGYALHSFTGSASGSFSATGRLMITAVPEPASWLLMIGGFALCGVALRSRRSAGPLPAA